MTESKHIETRLIHAGRTRPAIGGALVTPVFQSSTYECAGMQSYHDLAYIRLNNTPNHRVTGARLASLEGGESGLVTGSGMAAITATMLTLLRAGDHVLAQQGLYGGTHGFCTHDLPGLGIDVDFVRGDRPESWQEKLRDNTRLLYMESITNPLVEVAKLEAAVEFARANDLTSVIDNTFATPVLFRPLEIGFDIVVHSATKYLNGHSDIVAGVVVGRAGTVERITRKLNHLGGALDPHACFLLERGMKTLALRIHRQSETAQALAEFLAGQAQVARVYYPGLTGDPGHERAARLFSACGGVLSFDVRGGAEAADRLLAALDIPTNAPSLGGVETLVIRPATTTHHDLTAAERAAIGIGDGLVRVSVGIEAAEDLLDDFAQALCRLQGPAAA